MALFHRYLAILEYPFIQEINDESIHLVNTQELLLLWLEDRKIREYEIEERSQLKLATHNGDLIKWSSCINSYGSIIGCPYIWNPQQTKIIPDSNRQFLFWLVSRGIALDYEDNQAMEDSSMEGDDSLHINTNENFNTIAKKCEDLGRKLNVERRKQETLVEFVRRMVQKVKFSLLTQENASETFSLQDFPLAHETKDSTVNQVALVLRMLYLSDFRELQNEVNDLIVLGQEYTANPRLNTTLGKVGR